VNKFERIFVDQIASTKSVKNLCFAAVSATRLQPLHPHPPSNRVVLSRRQIDCAAKNGEAEGDVPPFGKGAARRVVVTGMGVVSSLGHDPAQFYDNLLAGKSGISLIESFDACE